MFHFNTLRNGANWGFLNNKMQEDEKQTLHKFARNTKYVVAFSGTGGVAFGYYCKSSKGTTSHLF